MKLRDWKPINWEEIKRDLYGVEIEQIRETILKELEKKSTRLEHSCNPPILGYKVKNPTLVIEPPMYLINLGEPIK